MATLLLLSLSLTTSLHTNEWMEFVGFSKDERFAAYRHDVRQPRADGTLDQFTIFHTVDTNSGYEVATFKGSAIQRVTRTGQPVKVGNKALLNANPSFANAYPNKRWRKLKRCSRFRKTALAPGHAAIRVGSNMDLGRSVKDRGLYLGRRNHVEFEVFAEEPETGLRSLGHFGQRAEGSNITGRLQLFSSPSGKWVAAVVIFLVDGGDEAYGVPNLEISRLSRGLPRMVAATTPQTPTEARPSREELEAEQGERLDNMYKWMTGAPGAVQP